MHSELKPSLSDCNKPLQNDRYFLGSHPSAETARSTDHKPHPKHVRTQANDLCDKHARSKGFALMLALGLMSFVLLLILSMSSFVQINANVANAHKDSTLAKQNALFALKLALGNLQNEMGPDRRISATAGILDEFPETETIDSVAQPHWTGVWNSEDTLDGNLVDQTTSSKRNSSDGKPSNFRQWLVSLPMSEKNPEELIEYAKTFNKTNPDAVQIVGDGTLGTTAETSDHVFVPRQVISQANNQENGYAYWVGDEGVKSKIAGDKKSSIQTNYETVLDANNAANPRLNAIEGFENTIDISEQVDKLLSFASAEVALSDAVENTDVLKNNFHSLSIYNKGLLIDVKNGGIKKDLSLLFTDDVLPMEYDDEPIFTYQG
ncbi:MAG: hypothetical protein CML12_04010, partial [Puniceicoccaceae bacterium]|nr:hypothetical protein [Puniceicoccaceae bacterium]